MDIINTPLAEQDIATLVTLGVNDFHNDKQTGSTYIKKRFWNGCTENKRNEIIKALETSNVPREQTDKGIVYSCTDVGNSERFVAQHGHKVRHIAGHREGWLVWDGTRWKNNPSKVQNLAKVTAKSIYREAEKCKTKAGEYELSKWAKQSQFDGRIFAMLKLAKSDLTVLMDEFDGDEYKINCKNGYLDLKTGKLAAHSPDMLLMKRVNASYDPEAKCPNWERFVDAVCLGDKELVDWLQRLCGYLMTGSVKQQQFYIMYGEGGNGKGTLNEVLMHVLGNYSAPTQSEIFLASNTSSTRALEIVGRLKGIRFATASEVGAASRWSEETVKQLTGEDTITGASMYSPRFDFTPTAKIVFQINHLPMFRDASYGFKRRMCVIPFKAKFEGDGKDLDLKPKLKRERDGVFRWLVDGARRYLEEGLEDTPAAIYEATERYIEDNDTLSPFINAELVKEVGAKCYVSDAYIKYVDWCRRNDTEAASRDLFVKRMEERGIYRGKRDMKGMPFIGYKLRVTTYVPPAIHAPVVPESQTIHLPVSNSPLVRTILDENGFIFEDERVERHQVRQDLTYGQPTEVLFD